MESLIPPKTNKGVWNRLLPQVRFRDIYICRIQKLLVNGMVSLLRLVNEFKKGIHSVMDLKDTKCLISDSLSLLCNAFYRVSIRRRQLMRSALPQSHVYPLCNNDVPITSKRIGEDVAWRIKDLDVLNRCTSW